ncbi:hypothetical protein D9611_014775 [Ephemerocybe angulata]|uniref:Uncharacterized protein n=1 Tax=Ephemerocybe angulata TaxID=980116 RepID=A0A8H5CB72_9AGAR|nr:hypothetical protein D9611_014775 [Tulosesus angulatus]
MLQRRTSNVSAEQTAEGLGFKLQDASDLNADRTHSTMRRSGLGYEGKGWQGSVGRRRRMEGGTGEAGPHWYVVPDSLVVYAHISTPSPDIVSDREILRGVSGYLPQTKNFAVLGVSERIAATSDARNGTRERLERYPQGSTLTATRDYESSFAHHARSRSLAGSGIFRGVSGCMVSHSGILHRPEVPFGNSTRMARLGQVWWASVVADTRSDFLEVANRVRYLRGWARHRGLRLTSARNFVLAHRELHAWSHRTLQTLKPMACFRARRSGAAGWYGEYPRLNAPHTTLIRASGTVRMDRVGSARGLVDLGKHGDDMKCWSDGGPARGLHWAPRNSLISKLCDIFDEESLASPVGGWDGEYSPGLRTLVGFLRDSAHHGNLDLRPPSDLKSHRRSSGQRSASRTLPRLSAHTRSHRDISVDGRRGASDSGIAQTRNKLLALSGYGNALRDTTFEAQHRLGVRNMVRLVARLEEDMVTAVVASSSLSPASLLGFRALHSKTLHHTSRLVRAKDR